MAISLAVKLERDALRKWMTLSPKLRAFFLNKIDGPLQGKKITITAGPTYEEIDPVRYIANRSSGKQGYAIATALAHEGADVTLISGPTNIENPKG